MRMPPTSHEQLLRRFDDLDADLGKMLNHYRKVKRDRKALLAVASDARDMIAKHLRSHTITRADFEYLHNSLVAQIAQAECKEAK